MGSVIFDPLANQWAALLLEQSCFAALHYAYPSPDDPEASEVSGPTYSRPPLTWMYASGSRLLTNAYDLSWLNLDEVTLIGVGVWSAATSGDLLLFAQLDDPVVVSDRGSHQLGAGVLWVQI